MIRCLPHFVHLYCQSPKHNWHNLINFASGGEPILYMVYSKKFRILCFVFVFLFFGQNALAMDDIRVPKKAEDRTASLYLDGITKNIEKNTFDLKILVNPGGQAINTVGIILNFPVEKIKVKNINIADSFCDLFVENNFDNIDGQIKISCGKYYPGINSQAEIATIKFDITKVGLTKFTFDESSVVLANDGFGTDVLESVNDKSIYLK